MLGQRIRNFRVQQHLSQEKLSELAGVHPTYIGQIERGEKNITVESLVKIASALHVPISKIFEKFDLDKPSGDNYPLTAYDIIAAQDIKGQQLLLGILQDIIAYKNNN